MTFQLYFETQRVHCLIMEHNLHKLTEISEPDCAKTGLKATLVMPKKAWWVIPVSFVIRTRRSAIYIDPVRKVPNRIEPDKNTV